MQVLTGYHHDHSHNLNKEGAYEWWYVDALSEDAEWGVVMIIFRGMPMSPDYLDQPHDVAAGYSLSVYHRGVRVAFAFAGAPLAASRFSDAHAGATVGLASFTRQQDGSMTFVINAPCKGIGRSAFVSVTLDGKGAQPSPESFTDDHAWILAAPRSAAEVESRLSEGRKHMANFSFATLAYHDHNMGRRAMSADFHDWYWGRIHTRDRTFIYLATPNVPKPFSWVGEVDRHGLVVPWTDVTIAYERPWMSYMGLRFHKRVVMKGIDAGGLRSVVVCQNARASENGPFYQRYVSRWKFNGMPIGSGTSEYMDLQRLNETWIRPFLRLPWKTITTGDSQ